MLRDFKAVEISRRSICLRGLASVSPGLGNPLGRRSLSRKSLSVAAVSPGKGLGARQAGRTQNGELEALRRTA